MEEEKWKRRRADISGRGGKEKLEEKRRGGEGEKKREGRGDEEGEKGVREG